MSRPQHSRYQRCQLPVDRALRAGADAVGATCEIFNLPGYLFSNEAPELKALVRENLADLVGEDHIVPGVGFTTRGPMMYPLNTADSACHYRRSGRCCTGSDFGNR